MINQVSNINIPFLPAGGVNTLNKSMNSPVSGIKKNFETVFQAELDNLKFSSHAMKRINSRDIKIGTSEMERLDKAISDVQQKGSKESLIMLDKNAFIINVKNKTVITAIDNFATNGKTFTNIDSAIIA